MNKSPPPPKHLSREEAAYWKQFTAVLVERGTLSSGDLPGLAMLCGCCADVDSARAELRKSGWVALSGRDTAKTHPAARALDNAKSSALQWMAHFGLTPASRKRADPVGPGAATDPMDEFTETTTKRGRK